MFKDFRYIRSVLMPGEEVVFATSLHWVVYMPGLIGIGMGVGFGLWGVPYLVGLLPLEFASPLRQPLRYVAMLYTVLACAQLLLAALRQSGTELVITDRRVMAKFGIISRTTYEISLNKIEGANLKQSAIGRLLGFGTIIVRGVGANMRPILWIDSPAAFQGALLNQVSRLTQAK